ncbi:hypothetical protein ERJ75_001317300 [Trypanosoma vivax]|nr:hypothetical protein TRVL_04362 [Trypanosoma vivax]KAH8607841.1 hypothetical protein ERJ75_001317300 [Trypanosoma vivax]
MEGYENDMLIGHGRTKFLTRFYNICGTNAGGTAGISTVKKTQRTAAERSAYTARKANAYFTEEKETFTQLAMRLARADDDLEGVCQEDAEMLCGSTDLSETAQHNDEEGVAAGSTKQMEERKTRTTE